MLHRTRQLFIRQQTSVINAIRAHMAEFGIVAALGRKGIEQLLAVVTDTDDQPRLQAHASPRSAPNCVGPKSRFLEFDRMIMAWHRSNATSRRLACQPGAVHT
jgi:transposase